jgi:hypothetical protein
VTSVRAHRFLLLALLLPIIAVADEASWDIAGNVEVQSRLFTQDALWPGQASQVGQVSVALSAELRWRSALGNQRASIIPYARWDGTDDERSIFDLREAYWAYEADAFELLIGANTVFWGVTESVHLVDIVNQTDAVADVDGEDKLGQPMVNLALQRDWGLVSIYLLPYFRERTFAGIDGRLRSPLPVDSDSAQYASSEGDNHLDLAIRYSHYIGDVDIGLSLFSGTSREPRFVPSTDSTRLLPYYDQIDQVGVDLQYTRDAWLWKLEAIVRDGFSESFAAAVGGFEYTFYQVRDSAADIGLLVEYQYDGRNDLEPFTIADNDVFIGTRLALNDIQNTAVLAGVAYDIDTGEAFVNVEAERRIGDNFFLELRLRAFAGAGPADRTFALVRDDYLQLQIARYF